jgi:hypothetical protein
MSGSRGRPSYRSHRRRYHTDRQPGAAVQNTASWTAQPLAGLPWPSGNQNGALCGRGFKQAGPVNVLWRWMCP